MKKSLILLCLTSYMFALPPSIPQKDSIKGINPEVFSRASFNQKREALKIDYDFRTQEHQSNEKFKQINRKLDHEIKLLRIDLQEAKSQRDETQVNIILTKIIKTEEKKRLNKEEAREQRQKIDTQRISKIYQQLGFDK